VSDTTSALLLRNLHDPGNQSAWQEFCARYRPVLVAFGRHLDLQEQDAQDAAQETLLAFVESYRRNGYDRGKGRLRNWLRAIALHKIRDIQRKRGREKLIADRTNETAFLDAFPDGRSLEEAWDAEWQRSVLQSCIEEVRREVKPASFQIFEECVLRRRGVNEVAAALGMSREAVLRAKTRVLSRIRKARKRLEADW